VDGAEILITRVIGSLATIIWCSVTSIILVGVLKSINRLRVNPKATYEYVTGRR
jgi:ammonia channel protein AmtB